MTASYLAPFAVLLPLCLLLVYTLAARVEARGPAGPGLAVALQRAGDVLAIFLISGAVIGGSVHGESLAADALWAAVFGLCALAVFFLASRLSVRALFGDRLGEELARDNAAAGLCAAAHALATGIIAARAMAGSNLQHLGLSLTFFVLAQLSLHLLVFGFRALTSYDDREEIIGDNLAAALSYAGITLAAALIVGRAVEGEFTGWLPSLRGYGVALAQGLCIYPVRQIVVQGLLLHARPTLRGGPLDHAIARERSLAMGALEGATYVAAALLLQRVS